MIRICRICNESKKTPYRDVCRNCYQKEWLKSLPAKICSSCNQEYKAPGNSCHACLSNRRNEKSRSVPCSSCNRIGLIIINQSMRLCTKCDRHMREGQDPSRADKRRDYLMKYSRKKKGTDLDAPRRCSKGWWLSAAGYVMVYKPDHPNRDANGCIKQHTLVMSEKLGRPLTEDENVHHINGIRDDNRIENLELWSKSQPCGQRVEDKIKWAKEILTKYADLC